MPSETTLAFHRRRRFVFLLLVTLISAGCSAPAGTENPAAPLESLPSNTPAAASPATPGAPAAAPPGKPALLTPRDGATVKPGFTRFTWAASEDADTPAGRLQYSFHIRGADGIFREVPLGNQRDHDVTLNRGETYQWWVTVSDGTHRIQSTAWIVQVQANRPPLPPTLLKPSSEQKVSAAAPLELTWRATSDPDGDRVLYKVILRSGGMATTLCPATSATVCRAVLSEGTSYEWNVVATDGELETSSVTSRFKANTPPKSTLPLTPAANARVPLGAVTFQASASSDADGDALTYRLRLEDVANRLVTHLDCGQRPQCSSAALRAGSVYMWSVEASDGFEATNGNQQFLYVNNPPSAAPIHAGADGAEQIPLDASFGWGHSTDVDGDRVTYDIYVTDTSSGRRWLACDDVTSTACLLSAGKLRAGTRHTIQVETRDALGDTANSWLNITTRRPIVLVHGYSFVGDAYGDDTWSGLVRQLTADGFPVLDFDLQSSTTTMSYKDTWDGGIPASAGEAGDLIERALLANGFEMDQPIDVVAHSMGGLVMRFLVEQGGVKWTTGSGYWHQPSTKWATQVRTLSMLATPNRGTAAAEAFGCWPQVCDDMSPGSWFLTNMGYSAPATPVYTTVGGGRDEVVKDASARLDGATHHRIAQACHTRNYCDHYIVTSPDTYKVLMDILDLRPAG